MGTVAVIGASRGIGLELVRQYARDGWRVHATTRTPAAPGALGEIAGDVAVHALEVTDARGVEALARALADEHLDVLVHNAGTYGTGMPLEQVIAINAQAPLRVVDALLPRMSREPPGRVVLMTSQMGSRAGWGRLGTYGESKARLNDGFRARAPAWAGAGVVAVVMHPGWVRTDMGGPGASLSVAESVTPMRRTIAALGPADHGRFLTWDGREHPW